MKDDDRKKLLERAARCRRLAAAATDPDFATSLIKLAEEYEETARAQSGPGKPGDG